MNDPQEMVHRSTDKAAELIVKKARKKFELLKGENTSKSMFEKELVKISGREYLDAHENIANSLELYFSGMAKKDSVEMVIANVFLEEVDNYVNRIRKKQEDN